MISRLLSALSLACLLTVSLAGGVVAHAELEESDPPDGGTITTPYTLTATFSEEFDPNPDRSFIFVRNAAGNEILRAGVSADDPTVMELELPELEPGEYTARWQTTTIDDQGVERGSFTFTVEATATPDPTASPRPTPTDAPEPTDRPEPTASEGPTAPPTDSPAPTATASPDPAEPQPSNSSDLMLALVLAGLGIAAVVAFVFLRGRGS